MIVARYYKWTVVEEHISVIEEPVSHYVGLTIFTSISEKDLACSGTTFSSTHDIKLEIWLLLVVMPP